MQTSDYISGNINSIVLQSLASGDKYGLEICKDVEEKTNGAILIKQPSLYSALKRLSEQELVSSYWKDSAIGGKRHYYKLTDAGKYALSDIKTAFVSRQMYNFFEEGSNDEAAVGIDIPCENINSKMTEDILIAENSAETRTVTEELYTPDIKAETVEDSVPADSNSKITIIKFDEDHNIEHRYEINDATDEEVEDILNQYIPSHATYSVSSEAIDNETVAKITKISIPKPDGSLLTETSHNNYIYSDISKIKKEEIINDTNRTTDDAVFLNERLDYSDVETILKQRNEELSKINFNEKYGSSGNKKYEKSAKEEPQEEKIDAVVINNYYAPLDAYSIYSHTRYSSKSGSSRLKQNYIDINRLNFVKHIILAGIALIEVIILSLILSSRGLIDYRAAVCLFIVLYPVLAFLTLSIFKFIYNKFKKGKTRLVNSFFVLEIVTYISILGIIFALNKMFGIQILDNKLVIDVLPFASWFIFPAVVFFNIILSAVIYWILKSTNKFYPKSIK